MIKNSLNPKYNSFKKSLTPLPKINLGSKQKTLGKSIMFKGVGLHSGKKVLMNLHPADDDFGIKFRVKKSPSSYSFIPAYYKNVSNTVLCTTLKNDENFFVSTTEHILSALYALELDNVIVELSDSEIPVMDGSSIEFVDAIRQEDVIDQHNFKKNIKIKKVVEVKNNNSIAKVVPNNETIITCEIGFNNKIIGNQTVSLLLKPSIYKSEISRARTFGFFDDISRLRDRGLALGGSLENAIVVSKDKILNKEGLRFNDEFVRHKALDFIGDLALSGHKLIGSFSSYHGGHKINNELIKKIFSSKENWEFVDTNISNSF